MKNQYLARLSFSTQMIIKKLEYLIKLGSTSCSDKFTLFLFVYTSWKAPKITTTSKGLQSKAKQMPILYHFCLLPGTNMKLWLIYSLVLVSIYTFFLVILLITAVTKIMRLLIKFLKIFQNAVTNKVWSLIVAGS